MPHLEATAQEAIKLDNTACIIHELWYGSIPLLAANTDQVVSKSVTWV